jgi:DNA gyrase subunit A
MIAANARDNILFFSDKGKCYQLRAWQVPSYDRTARGTPLINVINVEAGESITAILAAPDFENSDFLVFATRAGEVKKSPLQAFAQVRSNGLRAMTLEEGDVLLDVKHCRAGDEVILVTEQGRSARFNVDPLREASRISGGVRGIRLAKTDSLASMDIVIADAQLLVVTQNGYGKRTPLSAFMAKGRGIGGVRAIKTSSKTGPVAAARVVYGFEELMMMSAGGMVVRIAIETITERSGRLTSGVKVMNLRDNDRLVAIAILEPSPNGNGDDPSSEPLGEEDAAVLAALPTEAEQIADEDEDDDDAAEDEDEDEESEETDVESDETDAR